MIIQHKKSGKQYNCSPESWAKIQGRGDDHLYAVVQPETPKEIKAARANKNLGIDNTNNEGSNDPSLSEDSRADN